VGEGRGKDESHEERLDRELIEFLNELRVALPGVQVLFAFLLTIPFTGRFARLTDVQVPSISGPSARRSSRPRC
jgi:Family of unknown function (DUF6328)